MSRRFGDIRQIAYCVSDIEAAMRHWVEVMGVGPFFFLPRMLARGSTFRGRPTEPELSIALSQSGATQIELIQQHNDAPSPFRGFIDAGIEGQHHVAFWTRTFDADMARHLGSGYTVLSTARQAPDRNAFLETCGYPGTLIEISEINGPKGEFFRRIGEIAARWDGAAPIRRVRAMTPEAI
ncbi:MAG: VOC family protein [Burkholderiales bacterium]|nr:VOC family protein [Burkholderiales bacterium]